VTVRHESGWQATSLLGAWLARKPRRYRVLCQDCGPVGNWTVNLSVVQEDALDHSLFAPFLEARSLS